MSETRPLFLKEPSMIDCHHLDIQTWSGGGIDPNLWACRDCRRRFYPACLTCVDVGHRNIEHEAHIFSESELRSATRRYEDAEHNMLLLNEEIQLFRQTEVPRSLVDRAEEWIKLTDPSENAMMNVRGFAVWADILMKTTHE